MVSTKKLKGLAKKESKGNCYSFYLNCNQTDEKQLKKTEIFLDNSFQEINKDASGELDEELDWVEKSFQEMRSAKEKTLVAFGAPKLDFQEELRLPLQSENQFYQGDGFYLLPLLRLQEEYKSTAVVSLDSKNSLILIGTQGSIEREEKKEHDFPDRVSAGGWSELRYQHHIEKHLERNFKDVLETLNKFSSGMNIQSLLLAGETELQKKFEKMLSKDWKKKLKGGFRVQPELSSEKIFDKALEELETVEAEDEKDALEELGESKKTRESLAGILRALNRGKVRKLIIAKDFEKRGVRCEKEGRLAQTESDCKGEAKPVDLEIEIPRKALLQDAQIEVVSQTEEFNQERGIGAILRY